MGCVAVIVWVVHLCITLVPFSMRVSVHCEHAFHARDLRRCSEMRSSVCASMSTESTWPIHVSTCSTLHAQFFVLCTNRIHLTVQLPQSQREDGFQRSDHRLPVLPLHARATQAVNRRNSVHQTYANSGLTRSHVALVLGNMALFFCILPRPIQGLVLPGALDFTMYSSAAADQQWCRVPTCSLASPNSASSCIHKDWLNWFLASFVGLSPVLPPARSNVHSNQRLPPSFPCGKFRRDASNCVCVRAALRMLMSRATRLTSTAPP